MKRLLLVLLMFAASGIAHADPIGDNPNEAWNKVKAVIDTLDPMPEGYWDWKDNEWDAAVSASLYSFKSEELQLGSIRAGYAPDGEKFYVGPRINPIGLVKRYAPFVTKPVPASALDFLETNAKIGLGVGYDFDEHEESYGATFTVRKVF